jgi:hypothetical protein
MRREIVLAAILLVGASAFAALLVLIDARQRAGVTVQRQVTIDRSPSPTTPQVPRDLPVPMVEPQAAPQASPASVASGPAPAPRLNPTTRPRIAVAPPPEPISEPDARDALAWVGVDPEAEALWSQAINDPRLSDHDRQNLIEDLNETGFDDPRNLTAADLPVIEARMALIEQMAPNAMDKTNADAFAEAYKDLTNMRARLVRF